MKSSSAQYDAVIVGGGFYGCSLALHYARTRRRPILLVEADDTLLHRASFSNQARVHNGYHYPRSLLTAYRSRRNFDRFVEEFDECIERQVTSYYAIGRLFSNVTARQFELFCARIGAPLTEAPRDISRLFNPDLIDAVYRVTEAVFDGVKLRELIRRELDTTGIDVRLKTLATRVQKRTEGLLEVFLNDGVSETSVTAKRVFNCTYSHINHLLASSHLQVIPLKHELAEMAIVEVPHELRRVGITVMCGPFFSLLPFPPLGLHSLSHVRYTPHYEWTDSANESYRDSHAMLEHLPKRSRFPAMIKDAARYVPLLRESRHWSSLWEIKTVLPQSEVDDGRPILLKEHPDLPGLVSVLGSKLDNVYDMLDLVHETSMVEAP